MITISYKHFKLVLPKILCFTYCREVLFAGQFVLQCHYCLLGHNLMTRLIIITNIAFLSVTVAF